MLECDAKLIPLPLSLAGNGINFFAFNQCKRERPPLHRPGVIAIVTSGSKRRSQCGRTAHLYNLKTPFRLALRTYVFEFTFHLWRCWNVCPSLGKIFYVFYGDILCLSLAGGDTLRLSLAGGDIFLHV